MKIRKRKICFYTFYENYNAIFYVYVYVYVRFNFLRFILHSLILHFFYEKNILWKKT